MLNEQNKLYALITLCIFSALIFIITQATVDMYKKKEDDNKEQEYNGWYITLSFFSAIATIVAGIFTKIQYDKIKTTQDLAMYQKLYSQKKAT